MGEDSYNTYLAKNLCPKYQKAPTYLWENTGPFAKYMNRHFTVSMLSINMKKGSISLAIGKWRLKLKEIPLYTHENGWNEKSR